MAGMVGTPPLALAARPPNWPTRKWWSRRLGWCWPTTRNSWDNTWRNASIIEAIQA